jgi:hypothetical protein
MPDSNPDARAYIEAELSAYKVPKDVVNRITGILTDAMASYQSLHTRYTARLAEQLEEYKLRANAAEAAAKKRRKQDDDDNEDVDASQADAKLTEAIRKRTPKGDA